MAVALRRGRLSEARDLRDKALALSQRAGAREGAAFSLLGLASAEAALGNAERARALVAPALKIAETRATLVSAAGVLALSGEGAPATVLFERGARQFPATDTLAQSVALPYARAAIDYQRGNYGRAVEILEAARPYDARSFGVMQLRGEALLKAGRAKEALTEFEKIVDRGRTALGLTYPLAHVSLARAAAAAGDTAKARKAYQDFFGLWKDADPDIPVLAAAKKQYAELK
jgi:tetratricopeptide (TPR) repeat protein